MENQRLRVFLVAVLVFTGVIIIRDLLRLPTREGAAFWIALILAALGILAVLAYLVNRDLAYVAAGGWFLMALGRLLGGVGDIWDFLFALAGLAIIILAQLSKRGLIAPDD